MNRTSLAPFSLMNLILITTFIVVFDDDERYDKDEEGNVHDEKRMLLGQMIYEVVDWRW